jgi:hypothetical protein
MKRILIVKGLPNAGKSASVRLAYLALLRGALSDKGPTKVHYFYSKDYEVAATIRIGSVLVGISTLGDRRQQVKKALDFFHAQKCKVIVCAARSNRYPQEFAHKHKFTVTEFIKRQAKNKDAHKAANARFANRVKNWTIGE